jgi:glycerol-1-phosphate dehydrogenase [NAD(P)+]
VSHPSHPFLDELTTRLGSAGCPCGNVHRLSPVEVILGEDALESSARTLLRSYGAKATLWVLSDERTEAAAGERWKRATRTARISSRILPGDPLPVPTIELAGALAAEVRAIAPDLLVGVGSGVVSDLVKKVSLDTGLPNWCVATAASVDAYSSARSAIRVAGYHRAVPARPSEVIVCDLEVLVRAPRRLFLAGLGDLLAKYLASLDWRLAARVTGETYCDVVGGFALGSARRAIDAARTWESDPEAALTALAEAALVSGFAMQAFGSSRPAASAEHTVAHFWETVGAAGAPEHDLHGILVGAATKLLLPGYTAWFGAAGGLARLGELDLEARVLALVREPPWEATLEPALLPWRHVIAEEQQRNVLDRSMMTRRLQAVVREKEHILTLAEPLLTELAKAIDTLDGLGFPFSFQTLRIAEPQRLLPVRNVRLLRDRYTAFDLAHELGREGELLAAVAAGV